MTNMDQLNKTYELYLNKLAFARETGAEWLEQFCLMKLNELSVEQPIKIKEPME